MEQEWTRYSCQMALPGFDRVSQLKLQHARALIVGAGGLGCPAAQYLAAAGVGTIGIADHDAISESNLHRQILYNHSDIGLPKADTAAKRLQQQNPQITIIPHLVEITLDNALQLISNYDVVVDCTDNFDSRYLLNDAAVLTGKPLVYGAIYQYEGQVAVWNVANGDGTRSPNYRDVYPHVDATQVPNCSVGGVIPTLAGIIGCMQANEVLKLVTGTGELLKGRVLTFDAQSMQSRVFNIDKVTKVKVDSLPQMALATEIKASVVREGLAKGNIELVDIRTDQERDEYHIGGLHFELDELDDYLDDFKHNKTYVFYCSSGKRSAEAVKALHRRLPQVQAYSLKGGLGAWSQD